MSERGSTIIFPVHDLARAKALFSLVLGVEPSMDEAYYVGFDTEGRHVGLDPNGHTKGMTGPVSYWPVNDIKGTLQAMLDAGAQVKQDVTDVGNGRLVASVTDTDGNPIGLLQDS